MNQPSPRPWYLILLKYWPMSRQHYRLVNTFTAREKELLFRLEQATEADITWKNKVRELLADARRAIAENDRADNRLDDGWNCLLAAERHAVFGMAAPALRALALTLRQEASKLNEHRKQAVLDLVNTVVDDRGELTDPDNLPAMREALFKAMDKRDEAAHNQYFRIRLLRDQLWLLALVLGNLIASVWLLTALGMLSLGQPALIMGVSVFGALGASLSAALSLTRLPTTTHIPEQIVFSSVTYMRAMIGAAAALVGYIFLHSGLLNFGNTLSSESILAVAFISGFSERLIISTVERVTGGG